MMKRQVLFGWAIATGAAALAWAGVTLGARWNQERQCALAYEPPPPGMVLVPAGDFLMGSNDPEAEPDERPLRKVFLPAFYIDRHEVTNREWRQFKKDHPYREGADDLPVTFVLKSEAEAYCRFVGKRLPTGAEWEKAARGVDGRAYPWGDAFDPSRCRVRPRSSSPESFRPSCPAGASDGWSHGKLPVGSFPQGESPYGCLDMSGNVWEWVSDVWVDRDGLGLGPGLRRGIIRGGAYGYGAHQARTSYQGFEGLETTCHDVGFRCASDAVPKKR